MSIPAIAVSEEVRDAIDRGAPVLALESTIVTHGFLRPRNLEVAREAERLVRSLGVVPATIGVVAGRATVGLSDSDIEQLATGDGVVKAHGVLRGTCG